ncbi:MAG: bifunctional phosphoglucose/phosphomannose isomerase [Chlorobi bacterium]|nr:bifunctional phosphoglucose/phosphomannose isomerase [Chlorobiota bacterium]
MKLTQTNFRDNDPADMYSAIANFAEQIKEAVILGEEGPSIAKGRAKRVVILGMGGSAIGGDLLRSYVSVFKNYADGDVIVSRDYNPPVVRKSDLLVVSSYSGNTEETLSAYNAAKKNAGQVLVITTGGKLGRSARAEKHKMISLPAGLQPRAALSYSFFPLLYTLAIKSEVFGPSVKRETEKGISETIKLIASLSQAYGGGPKRTNSAFALAQKINGRVPVIYSATERLGTINLRWRGQIQENAKYLAFGNLLPEMNHNEINGWSHPANLVKNFVNIYLRDKEDHRRNKKRIDITKRIIGKNAGDVVEIESQGKSLLARMFSLIHLGDWVSFWLSALNAVDPSPVPVIEGLKKELAK